jgi:type III secretory pathway lipoprotein EscJ
LATLKHAIASYEQDVKTDQSAWVAENSKSARLSKALAKALNLLNRKGLPVHEDKQIGIWRKRMTLVSQKFKKKLGIRLLVHFLLLSMSSKYFSVALLWVTVAIPSSNVENNSHFVNS